MTAPALDCKSCRYWHKTFDPAEHAKKYPQSRLPNDPRCYGDCRRHAPVPWTGSEACMNPGSPIWSSTMEDDFCGDWEYRNDAGAAS